MASTQPLLQFKHSRMHSPFSTLLAISGSVNKLLPYPMISAVPSSRIFSPASTLTTRPTVATGQETTAFTFSQAPKVQL